jgi:N-dimethylarginine dimethylaminohydrolase
LFPHHLSRAKKHKDEDDLSKQLQSYAESLAKIQEDYLHLEKRLKTITEELERMRADHVKRFGVGRF